MIIRDHKISKKVVKQSITAMRHLIKMYQDRKGRDKLCPLCDINPGFGCTRKPCPWVVMTGEWCEYHYGYYVINKTRRRSRIRQLRYWVSVYEKALED